MKFIELEYNELFLLRGQLITSIIVAESREAWINGGRGRNNTALYLSACWPFINIQFVEL